MKKPLNRAMALSSDVRQGSDLPFPGLFLGPRPFQPRRSPEEQLAIGGAKPHRTSDGKAVTPFSVQYCVCPPQRFIVKIQDQNVHASNWDTKGDGPRVRISRRTREAM